MRLAISVILEEGRLIVGTYRRVALHELTSVIGPPITGSCEKDIRL